MTEYRVLKDWEKERYERVVEETLGKIELLEYNEEERLRKIDRGLRIQFAALLKTTTDELKQIRTVLAEEKFILSDAQHKLEYGVEIKNEEELTDGKTI